MPVSVACVWVAGHVPYGIEYVENLAAMTARHLDAEHEFVCLTDRPRGLPDGVRAIEVPPMRKGVFAWWAKINLFNAKLPLKHKRAAYFDLDVVIVGDLKKITAFPSPFALVPHSGDFNGKRRLQVVKRYNSSVMVWDRGPTPRRIYDEWHPSICDSLWGDQDFVGKLLPDLDTMPLEWFPRLSSLSGKPPSADAIVVLAKKPKPHVAVMRPGWIRDHWNAAR